METSAPSNILEAEGLSKTFWLGRTAVPVLRAVTLDVRAGETVAIVGASGAGKSTLLHILGGLDQPTGGRVCFQGRDFYRLAARERTQVRARRIGFVFQFYHLLPELDVLENVRLPAMNPEAGWWRRFRSRRNDRGGAGSGGARARELLRAVGLADRGDHLPAELSGGEQQRAALARALMNQPELVLADEPTGNLDSVTGGQVLDLLFQLTQAQGHTLVLVTHNEAVARRCGRRLELKDGCLAVA